MKIKVSELSGPALNWAVAKAAIGVMYRKRLQVVRGSPLVVPINRYQTPFWARYSTDPAQAWPIIDREDIDLTGTWVNREVAPGVCEMEREQFMAGIAYSAELLDYPCKQYGPTKLVAAMRCFVAFKLGHEVDVPDELL